MLSSEIWTRLGTCLRTTSWVRPTTRSRVASGVTTCETKRPNSALTAGDGRGVAPTVGGWPMRGRRGGRLGEGTGRPDQQRQPGRAAAQRRAGPAVGELAVWCGVVDHTRFL